MAGRLNRDIPESEAPAHVNPQPTDLADRAHIAAVREQETTNQAGNLQKQGKIKAKKRAKAPKKRPSEQPAKIPALLSVVLGSIVTVVVELLRQHRGK
jgi:hypothetical protein